MLVRGLWQSTHSTEAGDSTTLVDCVTADLVGLVVEGANLDVRKSNRPPALGPATYAQLLRLHLKWENIGE